MGSLALVSLQFSSLKTVLFLIVYKMFLSLSFEVGPKVVGVIC